MGGIAMQSLISAVLDVSLSSKSVEDGHDLVADAVITSLICLGAFDGSRTFTLLRIFSMVFPNTELIMSLKKSFSKVVDAAALQAVFFSTYPFNHKLWLYRMA